MNTCLPCKKGHLDFPRRLRIKLCADLCQVLPFLPDKPAISFFSANLDIAVAILRSVDAGRWTFAFRQTAHRETAAQAAEYTRLRPSRPVGGAYTAPSIVRPVQLLSVAAVEPGSAKKQKCRPEARDSARVVLRHRSACCVHFRKKREAP